MIAFASAVTKQDTYEACAATGIALVAEPDTRVLTRPAAGSIFETYNAILDEAAALQDLEALVLIHQDAEITDPSFCAKLRSALADPDVGVVGCVGAVGVRSIAWWEGSVTWASFVHRYTEFGGGDVHSVTWKSGPHPAYAKLGEVETVDGFVLALSPWVVQHVRFDESLGQALHGYDFDFCLQVRSAGRKIVTADFKVIHNHSLELASDLKHWSDAHVAVAEKWHGKMPGVGTGGGTWKQRARWAEADAALQRAAALSTQLKLDIRETEHKHERAVMTESVGWRLTAPVRWVERARARRRTARTAGNAS
jgi:hypothetical protein